MCVEQARGGTSQHWVWASGCVCVTPWGPRQALSGLGFWVRPWERLLTQLPSEGRRGGTRRKEGLCPVLVLLLASRKSGPVCLSRPSNTCSHRCKKSPPRGPKALLSTCSALSEGSPGAGWGRGPLAGRGWQKAISHCHLQLCTPVNWLMRCQHLHF